MTKFVLACSVMFLVTVLGSAFAANEMDEAKGLVEKAAGFYKANGKEKLLAEANNPKGQFVKGDVYVFLYDTKITVIAHPFNPALVGKNMLEVPDADGKYFRKDVAEQMKTKPAFWVDYKYKNPKSGKVEQKTTYVKKVDDILICAGAYK